MEVVEAQSVLGETIDPRSLDKPSEAADLREPDVVEHEDDDVGRAFFGFLVGSPPLL
jgi:hypothetical protein